MCYDTVSTGMLFFNFPVFTDIPQCDSAARSNRILVACGRDFTNPVWFGPTYWLVHIPVYCVDLRMRLLVTIGDNIKSITVTM